MVELLSLGRGVEGPTGDSWVLIEPHAGLYYITGRQNGGSVDASVSPEPFSTPETAMRAATQWADLLSVPYLYIRQE